MQNVKGYNRYPAPSISVTAEQHKIANAVQAATPSQKNFGEVVETAKAVLIAIGFSSEEAARIVEGRAEPEMKCQVVAQGYTLTRATKTQTPGQKAAGQRTAVGVGAAAGAGVAEGTGSDPSGSDQSDYADE